MTKGAKAEILSRMPTSDEYFLQLVNLENDRLKGAGSDGEKCQRFRELVNDHYEWLKGRLGI